ncbi:MAG: phosphoribosyltransferase [Myxococcota bacterium]
MDRATGVIERADLRNREYVFRNREHAGETLASMLMALKGTDAVVLAVPAGGVPVAIPIARELSLRLGCAVVSKMTLPSNTERGYGAMAFDGTVALNEPLVQALRMPSDTVQEGISFTREKIGRRMEQLGAAGCSIPPLEQRWAVLVDDGLASGFTMSVAVAAVRKLHPARLVVAVPTAHARAADWLASEADAVYCANIREGMSFAVASAYQDWYDVSEAELLQLLESQQSMTP